MKGIDYVIKETAAREFQPEEQIKKLLTKYWKEIYNSVLSLEHNTVAVRNLGVMTVSKFKLNNFIKKRISKIKLIKKKNISEITREKLLNQHYNRLKIALERRNSLAIQYYKDQQRKRNEFNK